MPVPGGRDPDHPLRRSGTPNEFGHGAVDWQLPRAAGPHPDLEQRHLMMVLRETRIRRFAPSGPRLGQAAPSRPCQMASRLDHFWLPARLCGWHDRRRSPGWDRSFGTDRSTVLRLPATFSTMVRPARSASDIGPGLNPGDLEGRTPPAHAPYPAPPAIEGVVCSDTLLTGCQRVLGLLGH